MPASFRTKKLREITSALKESPGIASLRELAISPYGLVSDQLRRKIWPRLLGLDVTESSMMIDKELLFSHRDYNQVVLDVDRSYKRFPRAMPEKHRHVMMDRLTTLIMRVLYNNPELHYYQGFHDICVTFLLILGNDLSFHVVDALTKNHLRDFMDSDMNRTRDMLNYLYPLLGKADHQLCSYMQHSEVGTIFCLSWLITWYGHVLDNSRDIARLYDFFLASHPLMPIYLATAIVLHRREEVIATECQMCYIHVLLNKVPGGLPYEELIDRASELFTRYPPQELAAEARLEYESSSALNSYSRFESRYGLEINRKTQEPSAIFKMTVWTLTTAAVGALLAIQFATHDMW